jgi:hypothetical protein
MQSLLGVVVEPPVAGRAWDSIRIRTTELGQNAISGLYQPAKSEHPLVLHGFGLQRQPWTPHVWLAVAEAHHAPPNDASRCASS